MNNTSIAKDIEPLRDLVIDALEELKGQSIVTLDVREQTGITDFMIVCTGGSNRQVKALADNVVKRAKEHGRQPLGVEGDALGEWILIDLGDVVAHVMQASTRDFYQLEKLWSLFPGKSKTV